MSLRIRGPSLIAPTSGVFTGRTAAYLHGATELADRRSPIELTVPTGTSFGPVQGLRIRHGDLHGADVAEIAGRRCTTGLATALAIAADELPTSSVAALDVLLRRGLGSARRVAAGVGAAGRADNGRHRDRSPVHRARRPSHVR